MTELNQLTKKRNAAKGWLSRSIKKAEEALETETDNDVIRELKRELECRLNNCDELQSQIEVLFESEEEMAQDIEKAGVFRDTATNVLIKLNKKLNLIDAQSQSQSVGSVGVKLPKIDLPKFSGDVLSWMPFWEAFQTAVDSTDLPEVSKLTYLRSLLHGEAKRCVEGLPLSGASYKASCEILEERFGRKELVILSHVQKLLEVKTPMPGSADDALQRLVDDVLVHIRSLEALGIKGDQYGVILTPLILSRVPADVRLEWARESEGKEGDLDFLVKFLQQEIERRGRSGVYVNLAQSGAGQQPSGAGARQTSSSSRRGPRDSPRGRPRSAAAALQAASAACSFCRGQHPPDKCTQFLALDPKMRYQEVRSKNMCLACLQSGHHAKQCSRRCVCGGRHHPLLCWCKTADDSVGFRGSKGPRVDAVDNGTPSLGVGAPSFSPQLPSKGGASQSGHGSQAGVSLSCTTGGVTVLPVAEVLVHGKDGPVHANLIFDSGADKSFVSEKLMRQVKGDHKGAVDLTCASFGGGKTSNVCNVYELDVSAANIHVPAATRLRVVEVPVICAPLVRPQIPAHLLQPFHHLQLAADCTADGPLHIDIVVGQDQYWSLVRSGLVRSPDGLAAMETPFGWVLSGSVEGVPPTSRAGCLLLMTTPAPSVHDVWAQDGFAHGDEMDSDDDDAVLKAFNESIRFDGSRYVVSVPWKDSKSQLMENRDSAQKRQVSLQRKLDRDPQLRSEYDTALNQMENDGIISEVPPEQVTESDVTFYLPHRPVVKETSCSTKVRPVFDASAKGPNGVSLNDVVKVGPSLMPNLLEVLLRFRRWRFGYTADIVKAFHQVRLTSRDRDAHRFLWQKGDLTRTMRFERVTMGVACSPFLLNATIRYHLSLYPETPVLTELKESLYVDDLLSGSDTEQGAVEMFQEAHSILRAAGMELSKCSSNSSVFVEKFQKGQQHVPPENVMKVLGVTWCREDDVFSFTGDEQPAGIVPTKRVVLSMLARIYDPVGFLTPFTVVVKCLFQELWGLQLEWDDELPPEYAEKFNKWLSGCKVLKNMKVPRCYTAHSGSDWSAAPDLELCVFADASPKAYGSCVYLRFRQPDGSYSVSFVMSKGRVAPLRQRHTLPRLELSACVLAAQLMQFVRAALYLPEDTPYRCWSDSMIALGWLRGDPNRWKQFVSNRVSEIQKLTDVKNWFHCRSGENPADLLTRGLSAEDLVESPVWINGPEWLSDTDADPSLTGDPEVGPVVSESPQAGLGSHEEPDRALDQEAEVNLDAVPNSNGDEALGESCLLGSQPEAGVCRDMSVLTVSGVEKNSRAAAPQVERYSTLSRATRVFGWILRFVHNVRRRSQRRHGELSADELSAARVGLFRSVQADSYPEELKVLRQGGSVHRSSPIHRLTPFLDADGLLRVRGRLQLSEFSYEERHPVILPGSHLATLIVHEQHMCMKHAGVSALMTAVRSEFWIVGLRSIARRVVRGCVACRRQDSRPCCEPAAPLPRDRVTRGRPFQVCGCDFAGPVFSLDFPDKKLYICLLCCSQVRAVHLELVDSLSLDDFMLAFRRFASRRGMPSVVYLDNARTFQAAEKLLRRVFGRLAPKFKFSVPLAPWWGGQYERMIRIVKGALKKSLGQRHLTRAELETVLTEIEGCVNSRPLTFVGDSPDCPVPLTPNHFLVGHSVGFQGREAEDPSEVHADELRARSQVREKRLNKFWTVWSGEYVRNLPPSVRKFRPQGRLTEGSVVLLQDEKQPRVKWDLGVVTKLFPGRDGVSRSAEVRTSKGLKTRAVQRLHDLEISDPGQGPGVFP